MKQQLVAVRIVFDWLITGQVMPTNPAAVDAEKVIAAVKIGHQVLDFIQLHRPQLQRQPGDDFEVVLPRLRTALL